jgi:hypothetical protein
MRRLFSTFAHGAPGLGLLLLRAAAAAALVAPAVHHAMGTSSELGLVGSALFAADALLVALGLWTPLTAGFGTVLALAQAAASPASASSGLMLAAVTAALALLGPGAWSIDARVFGWKRIESGPKKSRDTQSD